MEFVSPEGLRLDGRRPRELRQLKCDFGVLQSADGSATFEMGNTKVLAAVFGPKEPELRSQADATAAIVKCEYAMASFSTGGPLPHLPGRPPPPATRPPAPLPRPPAPPIWVLKMLCSPNQPTASLHAACRRAAAARQV